jgi:hypothetical protein
MGKGSLAELPTAIPFCKVLQKPAEKILIRYEKMPADFAQVVPHDPTAAAIQTVQSKRASSSPGPSSNVRSSSGKQHFYFYRITLFYCVIY